MSSVFSPKSCDPQAFRRWLRDGVRLYVRSLYQPGGLFVLGALGFVLRGGALLALELSGHTWGWMYPLVLGALALTTGFIDIALQTQMACLREGHRGWGALMRQLRQQRHHRLRTVAGLSSFCFRTFGLTLLLLMVLHGINSAMTTLIHPHGPLPLPPWPLRLMLAGMASATVSLLGLFNREGGVCSFVRTLRLQHPLTLEQARHLSDLAETRNPALGQTRGLLVALAVGISLVLPLGMLVLVPLLTAVLQCAYEDIFGDGYRVKEPVRAPAQAPIEALPV